MKRKILIVAGIVVLIFGILAALPFLYKDKLLAKVKTTLNNQVNAKIDFTDFKLSLFSQFPKVEMEIRNLSLVGIDEFASDTIFSAGSISTNISLMEMISGKGLELNSLTIENPRISLISDKAGKVNWDIAKTSVSAKPEAASTEASTEAFKMKLSDIRVNNLNLLYNDLAMPMKVWVKNTNITSSGDVAGTVTSFNLKGDVGEFIFEYDSVKYISKTKLKAETLLKVDYEKMNFGFDQGKLWINNLPLEVNGSFAMPNDSMQFDLAFQSEKSDFATILSLVPADYQKYLEKADIKGSAEFKGSVKGLFYNEIYPAIDILLSASNASFKYQDLPESVQDIQVLAQITKPEGDLNLLKVNVEKAHASIKNNPMDLRLLVTEPMTDPNIDASFSGTIDFASLKQAIPIDSLDITGILKAKMQMAGRMSSIEKQEYEKFQSNGEASVQNFRIQSNQLTKPIEISQGQVKANTKQINIERFDAKVGQSDFSLHGNVSNYLAYMFKNGVLKGDFNLKSSFLNFSELSNIQKPVAKSAATDAKAAPVAPADSVTAFQVPKNLDLSFQSSIQKAVYDKMPINNINGLVKIKDQKMDLTNLTMEMLQGKLAVNGSYTSNKENKPLFDFKLDMQNIDLPTAYQSLSTMRHYLPIAARSQGKISTQFGLSGTMNEKMNIVPTSLNGLGIFNTQNLMIIDSPVFDQIRGIIKKEKLKNVKVDDFTAKFQFENGELKMNPFKTNIADQQATIYGSLSAAREINLNMDFVVNREDLGADINKGLDILPGSQNIKMIDASVILNGSLTKPEVSLDLSKARAQIEQQVKKASVDELKGSVKKIGDELKKLFK
ncbi:outer membrane assembly protein [Aquipluma nitroreducens]|uniref:Outer membrane assembly protein n=1 Tax=Aquipluma nitroreducens TaxID=2010828 RepID=A0A5K7SDT2_9BACT|nr:AsmA-like C-terminal region-containing protein [Aquipluma nitroreducens]BBE19649.1 outer membrane assembly protein [Aquipluma nitroreducens]